MPKHFVCPVQQRRLADHSKNRSIKRDLSDDSRFAEFFSSELSNWIELQQLASNDFPSGDWLLVSATDFRVLARLRDVHVEIRIQANM